MEDIFKTLFSKLKENGIIVSDDTLQKHPYQGWMSTVYTVGSDQGKLIIHLVSLVKEHEQNKVWDKFTGLASILSAHPEIPSPRILLSTMSDGKFVLVQKFFKGERAGKRKLQETIISDDWSRNKQEILPAVMRAIAKIHTIQLQGFGWPRFSDKTLIGSYNSWQAFFQTHIFTWVDAVQQADIRLALEGKINSLQSVMENIVESIIYIGPSVLIHGDVINPSNILVRNQQDITLLDWEWSIAGDPAWEFCDLGWWDVDLQQMQPYFQAMKMEDQSEQNDFFNRIQTYIPLWLLWGTYMHAEDEQPDIYIALRKLLSERVNTLAP